MIEKHNYYATHHGAAGITIIPTIDNNNNNNWTGRLITIHVKAESDYFIGD